jgi:WD40 repeat protein
MTEQTFTASGAPPGAEGGQPWAGRLLGEAPDKRWVAAPGPEHTVQIWQVEQSRLWAAYYGHQAGVYNRRTATVEEAAWVDNERVVSRSSDGSIHLWNARSGIHTRTFAEAGERAAGTSLQDIVRRVLD